MAKNSGNQNGGGTSKFKMVMIEGELSEANFAQFAQVVGNALRGPSVVRPISAPAKPVRTLAAPTDTLEDDAGELDELEEIEAPDIQHPKATNATTKKRKTTGKAPEALEFDMKSQDVPLAEYVRLKNPPKENNKRFLVVASWFKDHAGVPNVTINHVYSAFRQMGWPTNLTDWDLSFRKLVAREWMKRVGTGEYTIAYFGQDQIDKMGEPITADDASE